MLDVFREVRRLLQQASNLLPLTWIELAKTEYLLFDPGIQLVKVVDPNVESIHYYRHVY